MMSRCQWNAFRRIAKF